MRKRGSRIILIAFALIMLSSAALELSRNRSPLPEVENEAPQAAPNPPLTTLLHDYAAHRLARLRATTTPPIAIAIVRATAILWRRASGVGEAGRPASVDGRSVFRRASGST